MIGQDLHLHLQRLCTPDVGLEEVRVHRHRAPRPKVHRYTKNLFLAHLNQRSHYLRLPLRAEIGVAVAAAAVAVLDHW